MRDLDLTSLRLFVTVCDTGNMSRAAVFKDRPLIGARFFFCAKQIHNEAGTDRK